MWSYLLGLICVVIGTLMIFLAASVLSPEVAKITTLTPAAEFVESGPPRKTRKVGLTDYILGDAIVDRDLVKETDRQVWYPVFVTQEQVKANTPPVLYYAGRAGLNDFRELGALKTPPDRVEGTAIRLAGFNQRPGRDLREMFPSLVDDDPWVIAKPERERTVLILASAIGGLAVLTLLLGMWSVGRAISRQHHHHPATTAAGSPAAGSPATPAGSK